MSDEKVSQAVPGCSAAAHHASCVPAFCTNMANAGMDIKALQYVMGHSDASITLNVYTHASYDHAAEQMAKLVDFPGSSDRQERKMSG